ncbi:MAG: ComF family protein [Lachnospiraceae bacterium]|nr:ComF family protein [Lachnospiraceae bacterium]
MPRGGYVCKECEDKVPYVKSPTCYRCGKEVDDERKEYCHDCSEGGFYYKRGVAPIRYNAVMKRAMEGFKYFNKREYADFFVEAVLERYKELIASWEADLVIPVPIHKSRLRQRGYNQAELLASRVSTGLGLEMRSDVLIRTKKTEVQNKLNDKERQKNIEEAFKINKNVVQSKRVVIIDDIYTTGSTINACAKVLKQAGAADVYCVCACIGAGY